MSGVGDVECRDPDGSPGNRDSDEEQELLEPVRAGIVDPADQHAAGQTGSGRRSGQAHLPEDAELLPEHPDQDAHAGDGQDAAEIGS